MSGKKLAITLALSIIVTFLILVGAASAQLTTSAKPAPPAEIPTSYPFDLSDEYYRELGVDPKAILDRKTGYDGLSVPDKPASYKFAPVRILISMPAYDQNGAMRFWYPLGDLPLTAFMDNRVGEMARRTGAQYPIYVFPHKDIAQAAGSDIARQAPIIANPSSTFSLIMSNPSGLRQIHVVTYTEAAFLDSALPIMNYMLKKNGAAADDTPIIRSVEDLMFLGKLGLVSVDAVNDPFAASLAAYTMGPLMGEKMFAPDSFLWTIQVNGGPLPSEVIFLGEFDCIKKTGAWCTKF